MKRAVFAVLLKEFLEHVLIISILLENQFRAQERFSPDDGHVQDAHITNKLFIWDGQLLCSLAVVMIEAQGHS